MNSSRILAGAAVALLLVATAPARAAVMTVFPGDPSWGNPPGENGGGGSSAITGAAPRSGAGSVELRGDRTRWFGLGNPYDSNSNIGLLNDVLEFFYDWSIATDSVSGLHPDYTPALRLHIWDGNQRSELIWEGAYNGTYGNTTKGDWYTTTSSDAFWRWETGIGVTLDLGAQVNQSIAEWATGTDSSGAEWYSDAAYVAGVSIGAGSSAGGGYHAFADNLSLQFIDGALTTYNFEVQASVPAPGVLALVGTGLLLCGVQARRRRQAG